MEVETVMRTERSHGDFIHFPIRERDEILSTKSSNHAINLVGHLHLRSDVNVVELTLPSMLCDSELVPIAGLDIRTITDNIAAFITRQGDRTAYNWNGGVLQLRVKERIWYVVVEEVCPEELRRAH